MIKKVFNQFNKTKEKTIGYELIDEVVDRSCPIESLERATNGDFDLVKFAHTLDLKKKYFVFFYKGTMTITDIKDGKEVLS